MERIDLHAHTNASDGVLSPAELVALAATREVTVLGITDHDTVDGIGEAVAAGGVRIVPGIEMSTRHAGRSVHVLGYFIDTGHDALRAVLRGLREERVDRARRMVARLNELGYDLTFEEVCEEAGDGVVARPHVARVLVRHGYVRRVGDAFAPELIADGGLADVSRSVPDPAGAVALIRGAGGAAVLAHPGVLHHDGPEAGVPEVLIRELRGAGLAGLEVDHPDHAPDVREKLRHLADELDLIPTGGSDFHTPDKTPPGACTTASESLERLAANARTAG